MTRLTIRTLLLTALLLLGVRFAAAQQPALVKPTAELSRELRTLFDVLRRVCEMEYFRENELHNDALIQFGVLYNNNLGPYRRVDAQGRYRLPASYVEKVVMQYFGRGVEHHSVGEILYRNNSYLALGSDAGERDRIEISRLMKLDDDLYEVHASFYTFGERNPYLKERMKVRRVMAGKRSRFIVVEYQLASLADLQFEQNGSGEAAAK